MSQKPMSISPYLAEFIATFALTFIGAGATIASSAILHASSGEVLLNIALAHGLVLAIMVTATGHISGGHVNPAVTVGLLITRRIALLVGIGYIVAQLLGAIVAAYGLTLLFPHWADAGLGTPALNTALGVGPLHGITHRSHPDLLPRLHRLCYGGRFTSAQECLWLCHRLSVDL